MRRELVGSILDDEAVARHMADALKAIGNPTRLRIMAYLACAGEKPVNRICEALGLPQAVVSQQLKNLRMNGQVKVRPEGGFRHYSVATPMVGDLLTCLARCCQSASSMNPA